jgi:hypothetical protein
MLQQICGCCGDLASNIACDNRAHAGWVRLIACIVEFLPYSAENPKLGPVIWGRERL